MNKVKEKKLNFSVFKIWKFNKENIFFSEGNFFQQEDAFQEGYTTYSYVPTLSSVILFHIESCNFS